MRTLSTLLSAFVLISFGFLQAQEIDLNKPLPVDPSIRIGKLDNGFTYYIKQNNKPENRLELRLAVNAGSILETDEQQGLAHFVEHMCFNGTKHFEKNELITYLQSIGVKFGPDLNAYTSFDETVYMLTVPSDSTELVDKGFLVMEDWAHNVTFEDEEIDKERGVIIEEWRMGRGPWQRMLDQYLPVVFKNSHYAERLPIGKKEVLESFEYQTIKDFYQDWYRPDLMALVVVGNIDPEFAESKIKEHFNSLTMPKNPQERKSFDVPDHDETLVSITTDHEAPVSVVRVIYKDDARESKTYGDYLESLKYSFISGILNQRLSELGEKAEPPFVGAGFNYGSLWARSKNAFQGYAVVGEKGISRGIETLLVENERIRRHGFTQGEFDRYKLDILKRYEEYYNERDKTESENYADEYVRNYLEGEAIPGIEFEYQFVKNHLDQINLSDVNALAAQLIKKTNRVIVVNAPQNDQVEIPTEEALLAMAANVDKSEIEPYIDNLSTAELIKEAPVSGSVIRENRIESISSTELILSNGIRVLIKPTDFKNDEILMSAYAFGGTSVYGDEDHASAENAGGIAQESGISTFSNSELRKMMAGKTVYVAPTIGMSTQNLVGSCRPADLEEMMQLSHLHFTAPRSDKEAFDSYISKRKDLYRNLSQDPTNYFYDQYNRFKSQDHPRGSYLPSESYWDEISFERSHEIYKDRFADASEFTFVFVGAINIDEIKPLLVKYLGSLPSLDREQSYVDLGIRPPSGKAAKNVYKGVDQKSLAFVLFDQEHDYNEEDAFLLNQLGGILGRRYYEVLREEMSGVYGVRASAFMSKIPYEKAGLQITIPCSPENVDNLIGAAIRELKEIQENGVPEEDLIKAKEIYRRDKEKKLEMNKFWLETLVKFYMNGKEFEDIVSYENLELITSENIQRVAKQYINSEEYLQVVLYPESMKE